MIDIFRDNTFTFTGKLALMQRSDAFNLVKACGGSISKNVTRRTSVLVVGSYKNKTAAEANKVKTAEHFSAEGYKIMMMSEDLFYHILLARFTDRFGSCKPQS